MLDRESTFADPVIVKLLQERFIPVAIDQAYQRRQKDNEGRFYRKIVEQSPRNGNGTTQGLFSADAAGRLLGFTNNRGAKRVLAMMTDSLQKYRPLKVTAISKGAPDERYNPSPPKGGLVVCVTTKVLGGYEKPKNEFRRILQASLGRDNLWIRADEHADLVKGVMPQSLLSRIARFHLVDNTRGEPPMWKLNEIEKLEGGLQGGLMRASIHLQTEGKDRGYELQMFGHIESKGGKVTRFDLIAKGYFWGAGTYTREPPKGRFPLAIAFTLADGKDPAYAVPPQASRGWVDGYIK